nr:PREDICTED: uncharacterized protein LOC109449076 isoform X2 [Rhinolophus sinicus]
MMMMSRTQPLGEGRRFCVCVCVCVCVWRREGCEQLGEGTRREREGAGQAPGQDTPAEVFSPPPPGKQRGSRAGRKPGPRSARRIDDSASGHGHLGEGQRRGRRSADVIDGLGGACGNGGASAVLAVRRDWPELRFSRSPRRPPFHIPQRRRGQPRRRLFTSIQALWKHTPCLFAMMSPSSHGTRNFPDRAVLPFGLPEDWKQW